MTAETARTGPDRGARRRVVVVDDDEDIRSSIAAALEAEDWEVVEAPSGAAALAILDGLERAVVLTDYRMPDMDGARLGAEIRARHDDAFRLVLMTAARDVEALAARHGFALYLGKPFGVEDLLAVLEQAVRDEQ